MKERPILFSGPMVRALLEGSKTQTRRICKPANAAELSFVVNAGKAEFGDEEGDVRFRCPYGQPGDRLWVKETFYCDHAFYPEGTPASCYWDGKVPRKEHSPEQMAEQRATMLEEMYFRADGEPEWEAAGKTPWRPSIHMPRWVSRITLEVTGVRVERLQDISEADARAEGCDSEFADSAYQRVHGGSLCGPQCRYAYAKLWDVINGAGAYAANPWVWVIEFRRIPQ